MGKKGKKKSLLNLCREKVSSEKNIHKIVASNKKKKKKKGVDLNSSNELKKKLLDKIKSLKKPSLDIGANAVLRSLRRKRLKFVLLSQTLTPALFHAVSFACSKDVPLLSLEESEISSLNAVFGKTSIIGLKEAAVTEDEVLDHLIKTFSISNSVPCAENTVHNDCFSKHDICDSMISKESLKSDAYSTEQQTNVKFNYCYKNTNKNRKILNEYTYLPTDKNLVFPDYISFSKANNIVIHVLEKEPTELDCIF